MFLSSDELSQLTGYSPNQRVRTCRWLKQRGIPYEVNRLGDPVVLRSAIEREEGRSEGPDLSWLEKPSSRGKDKR